MLYPIGLVRVLYTLVARSRGIADEIAACLGYRMRLVQSLVLCLAAPATSLGLVAANPRLTRASDATQLEVSLNAPFEQNYLACSWDHFIDRTPVFWLCLQLTSLWARDERAVLVFLRHFG